MVAPNPAADGSGSWPVLAYPIGALISMAGQSAERASRRTEGARRAGRSRRSVSRLRGTGSKGLLSWMRSRLLATWADAKSVDLDWCKHAVRFAVTKVLPSPNKRSVDRL